MTEAESNAISRIGGQHALERRTLVPIKWWAAFGALWLAFMAFVLTRWVAGPFFERVPVGPSDPPMYMQVFLTFLQVTMLPAIAACWWWFVARPWRRQGRLSVDGALVIAYSTLFFQDPISNYYGHWITYNSWSFNRGSWVNGIPGWQSFGAPGHMVVEPPLTIVGLYVVIMLVAVRIGVAVLRWASARWPQVGKVGLGLICFVAMAAFDVVFEGVTFMPLGVWTYAGGHVNLFPSTYHAFPLHEAFLVGILLTAFSFLRFFLDDKGRTLAERGSEHVHASQRGHSVLRALAIVGAINLIFLVVYTLPNSWVGAHSRAWTEDVQKRSYFLDGLCGEDTPRACPGPAVPLVRNANNGDGSGGSAYAGPDGRLVIPRGVEFPKPVPLDRGQPGSDE